MWTALAIIGLVLVGVVIGVVGVTLYIMFSWPRF